MVVQFILLAVGAYLLGSVPTAYLAIKSSRGVDIRKVGTGKVGAANILNAGPKWMAVPVALFDIGKGAMVVWIAKIIGLTTVQQVTVGLLAIVGHNWPIYLGFKSGGRGVSVSFGVISILSWEIGLIALICTYILAPIKQVAFGVFIALISLPFLSYFLAKPFGIVDRLPITCGFGVLTAMALSKRLVAHRTELSKNIPLRKVIVSRLLFDRDISDRRLWISRGSKSNG
jgi:glycerol-3-phosphate acyltransferase PlsY